AAGVRNRLSAARPKWRPGVTSIKVLSSSISMSSTSDSGGASGMCTGVTEWDACEGRLKRDGGRIAAGRKETVPRGNRRMTNNPRSTLYGERGSSAALQLVLAAVYRSIILQPLIDFLHVGGRQHAGGFTQLDGIDDVVIQRSRIIAAGLVQLTLRLQYFHQ